MSGQPADTYWDRAATCVAAAAGDVEALAYLAGSETGRRSATTLRLDSALAIAARQQGCARHDDWRRRLQETMTAWLMVDRAAAQLGEILAGEGVAWLPIKGYDVGTRFFEPRESRPTSDLDVLVDLEMFDRARRALEAAGWQGLETSERAESYLRDEGYAWQAVSESGALVEVHFRLWGLVPEGFDRELFAASGPAPDLGSTAQRLPPEHALVIAAVHGWTQERPRALSDWRDVEAIVRCGSVDLPRRVIDLARRGSLQLPVALSAAVVERLWRLEGCGEIVAGLEPSLTRGERRLLTRLAAGGIDAIGWARIVLARLVGGRASRAGWRSVWRQVWPHPVAVERVTPAEWSWARRRLHHLATSVGR